MTDIDDSLATLRIQDDVDFWTDDRIDALTIIPLTSDNWQQISVSLEDIPFDLTIRWNETAQGWFMDVLSNDGAIDTKGIRLSPGINILDGLTITNLGDMYVTDNERASTDPTLDGLGDRYSLWYLPLAAL